MRALGTGRAKGSSSSKTGAGALLPAEEGVAEEPFDKRVPGEGGGWADVAAAAAALHTARAVAEEGLPEVPVGPGSHPWVAAEEAGTPPHGAANWSRTQR